MHKHQTQEAQKPHNEPRGLQPLSEVVSHWLEQVKNKGYAHKERKERTLWTSKLSC